MTRADRLMREKFGLRKGQQMNESERRNMDLCVLNILRNDLQHKPHWIEISPGRNTKEFWVKICYSNVEHIYAISIEHLMQLGARKKYATEEANEAIDEVYEGVKNTVDAGVKIINETTKEVIVAGEGAISTIRQWFSALIEIHPDVLGEEDYTLAENLGIWKRKKNDIKKRLKNDYDISTGEQTKISIDALNYINELESKLIYTTERLEELGKAYVKHAGWAITHGPCNLDPIYKERIENHQKVIQMLNEFIKKME